MTGLPGWLRWQKNYKSHLLPGMPAKTIGTAGCNAIVRESATKGFLIRVKKKVDAHYISARCRSLLLEATQRQPEMDGPELGDLSESIVAARECRLPRVRASTRRFPCKTNKGSVAVKDDPSLLVLPLAACRRQNVRVRFVAWLSLAAMWLVAGTALAQNNTLRVNKGFSPSPIAAGSPSQMTITLYNTDTAGPQTNVSVTDNFPANLSWTGLVSNSCGGTLNAPGASLVLSGGTVPVANLF